MEWTHCIRDTRKIVQWQPRKFLWPQSASQYEETLITSDTLKGSAGSALFQCVSCAPDSMDQHGLAPWLSLPRTQSSVWGVIKRRKGDGGINQEEMTWVTKATEGKHAQVLKKVAPREMVILLPYSMLLASVKDHRGGLRRLATSFPLSVSWTEGMATDPRWRYQSFSQRFGIWKQKWHIHILFGGQDLWHVGIIIANGHCSQDFKDRICWVRMREHLPPTNHGSRESHVQTP